MGICPRCKTNLKVPIALDNQALLPRRVALKKSRPTRGVVGKEES